MNYEAIIKGLKESKPEEVNIYISYLRKLETDKDINKVLKNKWYPYFKEIQAINLFKKVAMDGLFIDGQTITLQYKGGVIISYNYQAYKNKLLQIYPETTFDIQLVHQGDTFSFKKESGKVFYKHEIKDPFGTKTIQGAYCVIKNSRGEFLETLNMDEITKMKNVAKTQVIWKAWEGEMVLKSMMKRACKRHFNDIVVNIEKIDNENYELETVNVDFKLKEEIEKCTEVDELSNIYADNKDNIDDEPMFLSLLTKRKEELLKLQADDNS